MVLPDFISSSPLIAAHCCVEVDRSHTFAANRKDLSRTTLEEGGVEFRYQSHTVHSRYNTSKKQNDDICVIHVLLKPGYEGNKKNLQYISLDSEGIDEKKRTERRPASLAQQRLDEQALQNTGIAPTATTDLNTLVEQADRLNDVMETSGQWMVAGFGTTQVDSMEPHSVLQVAPMKRVKASKCLEEVQSFPAQESVVCAVGANFRADPCQGDSGGPLFRQLADGSARLVGVISFGAGCSTRMMQGPYAVELAGVYTRVAYYRDFLQSA